jgi:hypothetical protein
MPKELVRFQQRSIQEIAVFLLLSLLRVERVSVAQIPIAAPRQPLMDQLTELPDYLWGPFLAFLLCFSFWLTESFLML